MPRKQRSEVNRRPEIGVFNCTWGLFSKANALFRRYGVDVVVIARRPDGGIGGYQSRPGLAQDFLHIEEQDILGSRDVDPYMTKASKGVAVLRAMSSSTSASSSSATSEISRSEFSDPDTDTTSLAGMPAAEHRHSPQDMVCIPTFEAGYVEELSHQWTEPQCNQSANSFAPPPCICPAHLTRSAPIETTQVTTEEIHQPVPRSRIKKEEILSLISKFS